MRESIDAAAIKNISVVTMEPIDSFDDIQAASLERTIRTTNYTSGPITVATRSGLLHVVKPQRRPRNMPKAAGIVVELIYSGRKNDVKIDAKCILNAPLNKTHENLSENFTTMPGDFRQQTNAQLYLSLEELKSKGGIVYLPEVDLQVALGDDYNLPPHPFSHEGMLHHTHVDNKVLESKHAVTVSHELVDNEELLPDYYMSIHDDIYKLVPIKDLNRRSGLYITKHGQSSAGGRREKLNAEYVAPDDIKNRIKYIYTSPVDALALGNHDERLKRQIEENEQALKIEKQKLEHATLLEKSKYEEVRLGREKQKQAWDDRKAEAEAQRKKNLELVKYIPAFLSVAASIVALYSKSKS